MAIPLTDENEANFDFFFSYTKPHISYKLTKTTHKCALQKFYTLKMFVRKKIK